VLSFVKMLIGGTNTNEPQGYPGVQKLWWD
jgi:hypothetical protein